MRIRGVVDIDRGQRSGAALLALGVALSHRHRAGQLSLASVGGGGTVAAARARARSAVSLGGLVCAVAFVALAVLSPIYGHAGSDYECQFEDATSLAYKTRGQYARLGY